MPQITTTMGIIIGIDVGISTTKIVGLIDGKPSAPIRITAADPITSLYGAFGKYLHDNNLQLEEIEHVMLTGVGAGYVKGDVYGVKTSRCDEFVADALGARYESHLDHAIVVSMGTGTSFVMCRGDEFKHIGGIGIGGGTLQGLSRVMLNTSDIKQVSELAMQGNIKNINLLIGDISSLCSPFTATCTVCPWKPQHLSLPMPRTTPHARILPVALSPWCSRALAQLPYWPLRAQIVATWYL